MLRKDMSYDSLSTKHQIAHSNEKQRLFFFKQTNKKIPKFICLELEVQPVNCGKYCLFLIRWFSFHYYSLFAWLQYKNLSSAFLLPPFLVFWLSSSTDLGQISMTNCCKVWRSIRRVLKCDLHPAELCQQKPLIWIKTHQQKCTFTGCLFFFLLYSRGLQQSLSAEVDFSQSAAGAWV